MLEKVSLKCYLYTAFNNLVNLNVVEIMNIKHIINTKNKSPNKTEEWYKDMRKQTNLQPGPCPIVCCWHADSSSMRTTPRRHPSPKAGSGLAPYSSWQLLVHTRKITCHGKAGVCSILMWRNLQAVDLGNNIKPADTWKGSCWISNCVFLGPFRHVLSFFGWFSIGLLL